MSYMTVIYFWFTFKLKVWRLVIFWRLLALNTFIMMCLRFQSTNVWNSYYFLILRRHFEWMELILLSLLVPRLSEHCSLTHVIAKEGRCRNCLFTLFANSVLCRLYFPETCPFICLAKKDCTSALWKLYVKTFQER